MRNTFERDLELLNQELKDMGELCKDAIDCVMKGLFQGDMEKAQQALEGEKLIDQKERDIESMCMRLLLKQQPVARDLRSISSALKMISDMERIGDQAEDIAEILEFMEAKPLLQEENLRKMAQAASAMVTASVEAFARKDQEMALKVIADDDIVDDFFEKVKEGLLAHIGAEPSRGGLCLDLLMIAKYLERIADHATNIAEWVIYSITGKHPV